MKLQKKNMIILLFIVSFSLTLISLLMLAPSIKIDSEYILGESIPKKATFYLNNVSDEDIEVDENQFQENEGIQNIAITYHNKTYIVPINVKAPNIKDVVKTQDMVYEMYKGQSFESIFDINPIYASKMTYNLDSNNLQVGEYEVVINFYGQTITQKIKVLPNDTVQAKLITKYNYKNIALVDLVKQFLSNEKIDDNQISFSYYNTQSKNLIHFNHKVERVAASTYKLPLNMLITDLINSGQLTKQTKITIKNIGYDTIEEMNAFIKSQGTQVSLDTLQKLSIEQSNNTASHMLFPLLTNQKTAYQLMEKFGKSDSTISTIRVPGNQTTSDFMIQVLQYLWNNKSQYLDILEYLKNATPNLYYELYLNTVDIFHKYGFYGTAINDLAIVNEEVPYLIALYSNKITAEQFGQLAFIIHEWHKVNS